MVSSIIAASIMGLIFLCVRGVGLKSRPCGPADWRVVAVRQEQLPPVPIGKHDCRKRDWRQRHPHWPLRLHGIHVWSCSNSTDQGCKAPRKIAFKNALILKKVLIALRIADKYGRRIAKYALFYTENERIFRCMGGGNFCVGSVDKFKAKPARAHRAPISACSRTFAIAKLLVCFET